MGCCNSVEDDYDSTAVKETTPISATGTRSSYQQVAAVNRKAITEKDKWYHRDIGHQEAETRLRSGAKGSNGTYLVYDSPSRSGEYVLLVYNRGEMHRWTISQREDGKVTLGENIPGARAHNTVQELLHRHSGFFGKGLKLQYGQPVKLRGFITCPDDCTLRTV